MFQPGAKREESDQPQQKLPWDGFHDIDLTLKLQFVHPSYSSASVSFHTDMDLVDRQQWQQNDFPAL